MKIDILTLFPKMFEGPFSESIIKRAQKNNLIKINIYNLRDWANDKHNSVDDTPYGGGAGMVLKVDVIDHALHDLKLKTHPPRIAEGEAGNSKLKTKVILLTPQGKRFDQKKAKQLSKIDHIILVCGHYEGFDERVRSLVDEEISIGDYILTGGEIPAMVLVDAISRLIPGVLGKKCSSDVETFSMKNFTDKKDKTSNNLVIEYPQYTKPSKYLPISKKLERKLIVPKVLLSGNHQEINLWRQTKSLEKSLRRKI